MVLMLLIAKVIIILIVNNSISNILDINNTITIYINIEKYMVSKYFIYYIKSDYSMR